MWSRLVFLIASISHFYGRPASALLCFECNQRILRAVKCQNATVQDCRPTFQDNAVCLRTVQWFSTGQPNWIVAQCQSRSAVLQSQIELNKCTVPPDIGAVPRDILLTCTCIGDFCNGRAAQASASAMITAIALLALVTAVT